MTTNRLLALPLAALLLSSPLAMLSAQAAGPAVEGEAAAKVPIDGEVRHAMSEIRDVVAAALPAIRDGKFGSAEYRRLADNITDRLQQAAAHNRLPADTQAKLNAILAPLDQAARNLKTDGERALSAVLAALQDYGRKVEHAGWPGVAEKAP